VQSQPSKRAGGVGLQVLIGPREDGADGGTHVTSRIEDIEPPLAVGKVGDEVREPKGR
jgi:hypothetical protein